MRRFRLLFGNAPRTLNVRTSAAQRTWDIGLLKDTQIFERLNAQFRLEAINAFNTPVFRLTNTAFGTANFGKITSQANFPRTVQISLRLFW